MAQRSAAQLQAECDRLRVELDRAEAARRDAYQSWWRCLRDGDILGARCFRPAYLRARWYADQIDAELARAIEARDNAVIDPARNLLGEVVDDGGR